MLNISMLLYINYTTVFSYVNFWTAPLLRNKNVFFYYYTFIGNKIHTCKIYYLHTHTHICYSINLIVLITQKYFFFQKMLSIQKEANLPLKWEPYWPWTASQYCFGKVFPVWNFPAFYLMHANCPNGDGNHSSFGRFRYYYVNYRTFARR